MMSKEMKGRTELNIKNKFNNMFNNFKRETLINLGHENLEEAGKCLVKVDDKNILRKLIDFKREMLQERETSEPKPPALEMPAIITKSNDLEDQLNALLGPKNAKFSPDIQKLF